MRSSIHNVKPIHNPEDSRSVRNMHARVYTLAVLRLLSSQPEFTDNKSSKLFTCRDVTSLRKMQKKEKLGENVNSIFYVDKYIKKSIVPTRVVAFLDTGSNISLIQIGWS